MPGSPVSERMLTVWYAHPIDHTERCGEKDAIAGYRSLNDDEFPRFNWRTGFRNDKYKAKTLVTRFLDAEIGSMSPFLLIVMSFVPLFSSSVFAKKVCAAVSFQRCTGA